jgi:FKBP-type peptidyl-prolyl cis-trans isomerase
MEKTTLQKLTSIAVLSVGLMLGNTIIPASTLATTIAQDEEKVQIKAPKDVGAIPHDATVLPSGVAYKVLAKGDGKNHPSLTDDVTVHYTGWQTTGKMFGSTRPGGKPSTFPLGRLITGWQHAVPHMTKGEIIQVWIPGDLAYDLREDRPNAPKGMLVFEIELLDLKPTPPENPEKK